MSGPLDRFARPCEYEVLLSLFFFISLKKSMERFFPLGHNQLVSDELAYAIGSSCYFLFLSNLRSEFLFR